MPTPDLAFTVHGTPIGQGAMSSFGPGRMVHTNAKRLKPWRKAVSAAATRAAELSGWEPTEQAVQLACHFTFQRPAVHYRTGRFAHLLRDSAPEWPIGRQYGDIDHLIRALLDGLTASGVIKDDSQVVRLHEPTKLFADPGERGFCAVRLALA